MKQFRLLPLFFLLTLPIASLMAQNKGAEIRFEPAEVQLGDIELRKIDDNTGRVAIQVFNDGKAPLILQKVSGCCGTDIKE